MSPKAAEEMANAAYAMVEIIDRLTEERDRARTVAQALEEENAALTEEYRAVGEHEWRFEDGKCDICGVRFTHQAEADRCPSKRERRLVGPWEPVSNEGGAQ